MMNASNQVNWIGQVKQQRLSIAEKKQKQKSWVIALHSNEIQQDYL